MSALGLPSSTTAADIVCSTAGQLCYTIHHPAPDLCYAVPGVAASHQCAYRYLHRRAGGAAVVEISHAMAEMRCAMQPPLLARYASPPMPSYPHSYPPSLPYLPRPPPQPSLQPPHPALPTSAAADMSGSSLHHPLASTQVPSTISPSCHHRRPSWHGTSAPWRPSTPHRRHGHMCCPRFPP